MGDDLLNEVPLRRVQITSLLVEKARRTSDFQSLKDSPTKDETGRDISQVREDALWGRAAELCFEHAFLREELSEDEWERYEGEEYDYVLYPDSLLRTTVDVKSRVLAQQRDLDSVDIDEMHPWYNQLLVRNNGGTEADVYVQAIVSEEYISLTGWASRDEVREADKVYWMENQPNELEQDELRPLSAGALAR